MDSVNWDDDIYIDCRVTDPINVHVNKINRTNWSPCNLAYFIPDKSPGDGDPLLLPARELRPLAPDVGVVTLG